MSNPFSDTGASNFKKPLFIIISLIIAFVLGQMVAKKGMLIAGALIGLPIVFTIVIIIFKTPRYGLVMVIALSFLAIGLLRYVKGIPLGLSIDALLFLSLLGIFFGGWRKLDWSPTKNRLMLLAILWMGYTVLELGNPEMRSAMAWFYAMRGVALYMILIIPIAFMVFNKKKHLDLFLNMWVFFSILGTLKGMMQLIIGPDYAEQRWLDAGAEVTHILFGKLRVFSFYSDAGQFGAAQAHACITFGIIALTPKMTIKRRIIFAIASFLGLIGMMISGTRGAIAVPGAGVFIYLFLTKNFKIFFMGVMAGFFMFAVMKYTTIGQGIPQVSRMRTAFDPNEPSLMVRKRNQAKLAIYLKSRPMGGGIGSAGSWGLRFSPNSLLAQTPTDSWYVKIWAEMGIIGLYLHLIILFTIVLESSYVIWAKLKNPEVRQIMLGLIAGVFGIMAASYGNGILGQVPTGSLMYLSWAFLYMAKNIDKECETTNEIKKIEN